MNAKSHTIREFVSASDEIRCFAPVFKLSNVQPFVFEEDFVADRSETLDVMGVNITASFTARLASEVVSLENLIDPCYLEKAMHHATKGANTSLPSVVVFALNGLHGARPAPDSGLFVARSAAKFYAAINAMLVICDKFYAHSKTRGFVLNGLFGAANKLSKFLVGNFKVLALEERYFAVRPIVPSHSSSNENCVNCWNPLSDVTNRTVHGTESSLYHNIASNGKCDGLKKSGIRWAISSQATLKEAEGSTTRPWSLNPFRGMAVKVHECAEHLTLVLRYSLNCMETCRSEN